MLPHFSNNDDKIPDFFFLILIGEIRIENLLVFIEKEGNVQIDINQEVLSVLDFENGEIVSEEDGVAGDIKVN